MSRFKSLRLDEQFPRSHEELVAVHHKVANCKCRETQ
jgi:hypothetical protein